MKKFILDRFYGNISRIAETFDKVFEKIREIGKK
jgi:hypothetical protein